MNSELSRIGSLVDDDGTTVLAAYTYLGVNRTAQVDFPEPGTRFTWLKQTGDTNPDPYNGWDRFGRAVDLRWMKGSAYVERIQHGYDRASNRLYRKNGVAHASKKQDELYHYDGLSQLDDFQRGVLNSGHNGIESGTLAGREQFNFDPTGNWNSYVVNATTTQTRTHNQANELTAIDSSSTLVAEDAAGNMTKVPKPDNWGAGYDLKYDAWNRLVEVKNSGGSTVATYGYDGLNRRITKTTGGTTRHFYYTDQWQIIEERVNTSTSPDRQFVWGLRYTDDLVLRDRGTERLYVVQDYFQPTAVTDAAGDVLERYGYEAYGTTRVMDLNFNTQTSSSYEWETRFGAYRWDAETNLYQVRNRYLHPRLGRWVTRDKEEFQDGTNLFAYALNNSTNNIDPLGLATIGFGDLRVAECEMDKCGGVTIDPAKQCCCDGKPLNKARVPTGIVTWTWKASAPSPGKGTPYHVWLEWPGGSIEANAYDSGFVSPGDAAGTWDPQFKTPPPKPDPLLLSPCEYNIDLLICCLITKAQSLKGTAYPKPKVCDDFVKELLAECMEESKGCGE